MKEDGCGKTENKGERIDEEDGIFPFEGEDKGELSVDSLSRIATLRARLAVRDPDTNPVDKMPWVAISPCPPLARKLPVLVRNALKTVWVCCGIPSPKQVYWLDDRRRLLVEIKSGEIVARAGRRRRRSLLDPLNP
jgi:hypothetical protein